MSTKKSTIEYIEDQLSDLDGIRTRKMFGEYAVYLHDKVVALVCDDTLYVKMTEEGKAFVGDRYKEGFPYPGAKAAMEIDAEHLEERHWLGELLAVTEANLPSKKRK